MVTIIERKDGKGNKICEKNREDTGKSRESTKKSIERNKVTSR